MEDIIVILIILIILKVILLNMYHMENTHMAQFNEQVINTIYKNEGGWTNDKDDPGGETYIGISRHYWPNWKGWRLIDHHKKGLSKKELNGKIWDDQELTQLVKEFYKEQFWDSNNLSKINSQVVASKVLDMAINMGSAQSINLLHQAVKQVSGNSVYEGDKIGPATLNSISACNQEKLHQALKEVSSEFYYNLVKVHPKQKKFLHDWIQRANQ